VKLDKQTVALLIGLATTLVGGAEMRFAVARVEASLSQVERRVQRIENELDLRDRVGMVDQ